MPLLTLTTNVTLDATQQSALMGVLSATVSKLLGKPESYVMVMLRPDRAMMMGATDEPCAFVELKSLGLPESDSAGFSEILCDTISEQIGVAANRIYIEFSNPARHLWGWDRGTFG